MAVIPSIPGETSSPTPVTAQLAGVEENADACAYIGAPGLGYVCSPRNLTTYAPTPNRVTVTPPPEELAAYHECGAYGVVRVGWSAQAKPKRLPGRPPLSCSTWNGTSLGVPSRLKHFTRGPSDRNSATVQ